MPGIVIDSNDQKQVLVTKDFIVYKINRDKVVYFERKSLKFIKKEEKKEEEFKSLTEIIITNVIPTEEWLSKDMLEYGIRIDYAKKSNTKVDMKDNVI